MFHLPALAGIGAAVTVVADPEPAARTAARRVLPSAAAADDWRVAVARPDVDAVVVCLPSHLHAPAAIAAFEAGRHAYVEKPLALDLDAALAVEAAWREAGTVGVVGFNFRYQPLVLDARRRVAAGEPGRVVAAVSQMCSAPRPTPAWKRARATGGGALVDLAVHHLDLLPFVLDDPVAAVSARLRSVRGEADTVTLTLQLQSGVTAQVLASAATRQTDRVEILGDRAVVRFDRFRSGRVEVAPVAAGDDRAARARAAAAELAVATRRIARTAAPPAEMSFAASLGAFLQGCRTGVQPTPSITDGVRVAAIVAAAERSAASGAVQPVGDPR